MDTQRRPALTAAGLAVAAGAGAYLSKRGRRRRMRRWLTRRRHYATGRLTGIGYRLAGRHPDPDVADDVLARRIQSTLGPLRKRLGAGHIYVIVCDHVASLHGTVPHEQAAHDLEQAALQISGVEAIRSHLRITPTPPRPGSLSVVRRRLEATVRAFGIVDAAAVERIIGGVLVRFLERVQEGERDHVLAHMPRDVRDLMPAPTPSRRMDDLHTFFAAVADTIWLPEHDAEALTRAVLDELRFLIPEEVDDVDATLPRGLKPLWEEPLPTT